MGSVCLRWMDATLGLGSGGNTNLSEPWECHQLGILLVEHDQLCKLQRLGHDRKAINHCELTIYLW